MVHDRRRKTGRASALADTPPQAAGVAHPREAEEAIGRSISKRLSLGYATTWRYVKELKEEIA